MLNSINAVISFLTILPSTKSSCFDLNTIANSMYLFPVAGLIIGCIIGGLAYGLSFYVQPFLTGFIATAGLVLLTGLHHTDALADFADGLMTKGDHLTRRNAMREPSVGPAGVITIVMYIVGMIIAISGFHQSIKLFSSVIAAEVIAKFVMVTEAHVGVSAWNGLSSPFTKAMKAKRKILAAALISVPIVWFAGNGYYGFVSLGVSLLVAALIQHFSNKAFGGISGDVIGASNEITRLCSLIVLSATL